MENYFESYMDMQEKVITEWTSTGKKAIRASKLLMDPPEVDVAMTPSDVVYAENKLRLLHYRPLKEKLHGPPLVIIYALVNKPYILDLQPDRSVVRNLLEQGFDVYLIDWGTPSNADRFLTLNDYVNGYIDRCVKDVMERAKVKQVSILGYCMGGSMSVMYAALHPENVKNLLIMAAPVDGDTDAGLLHVWSRKEWYDTDKIVDAFGNVPSDFMNFGFSLMDPVGNTQGKYARLMGTLDDPPALEMFLRMEKWVNDSIPIAGETFKEFLKAIYQDNLLIQSKMKLDGKRVDLKRIDMPFLNIMGKYDHLVPPEASKNLNIAVGSTDKEMIVFPTGHIGLSVSSKSHRDLWSRVAKWLNARSNGYARSTLDESPEDDMEDEAASDDHVTEKPGTKTAGKNEDNAPTGKGELTAVKGVGPAYLKKLKKAGVKTAGDLAGANLTKLSKTTGIPLAKAKDLVSEAKKTI